MKTKKTIPPITASKILRNKFNQAEKSMYLENYKTLKKEIEEVTNKWKLIPCPQIGRINIVKMSILPKAINRFNAIPIKQSKKLYGTMKISNKHNNLEKKNKIEEIMLPNIKLFYKAIVMKTAGYRQKTDV